MNSCSCPTIPCRTALRASFKVHHIVRGPGGRARCHSMTVATRSVPPPCCALLIPAECSMSGWRNSTSPAISRRVDEFVMSWQQVYLSQWIKSTNLLKLKPIQLLKHRGCVRHSPAEPQNSTGATASTVSRIAGPYCSFGWKPYDCSLSRVW